jgi:single-stranded-DNA-specific exonuclease
MLHKRRADIYKKLSEKTRKFVDDYVEQVVGISKMEPGFSGLEDLRAAQNEKNAKNNELGDRVKGNIGKILEKKKYADEVVDEAGEDVYFKAYNKAFLDFLFPDFESTLHDPFLMKDMQKAVDRVVKAILSNEKICVYGDYDCDGVPGTALIRDFFEAIGYADVTYYIPDRHKEGYGLNFKAIDKLAGEGVKLLITIDLGTTNVKEVEYASGLGIDTIITDHHLPIQSEDGELLPKAFAIINNKQASCNYPDKNLCGSGTIWKLVSALIVYNDTHKLWNLGRGVHKWLLDLVGIATIADMVPLIGENRTLAIYGLHVLQRTRREGLRTVLKNAKVELEKLKEDDVAFGIAPRVNAASRMDHPVHALNMFSQEVKLGLDSAHHLELLNQTRKENVANIMRKVHRLLDERLLEGSLPKVVVIGDSEWAPGILGLVSSAITEKYSVTSFVWGKGEDEEIFKGSCRSAGDIHLVKLMTEHTELFNHFGGHEEAGGFAIHFNNIHTLEQKLNQSKILDKCLLGNPSLEEGVEGERGVFEIDLEDVTSEFMAGLSLLGPFGVGNEKPIFKIKNIDKFEVTRFGKKGEHLKIILMSRTTKREAVKFFVDAQEEQKLADCVHELFFTLEPGYRSGPPRLKITL